MLRRRASRTTARASTEAMAAWAKPSVSCVWKSDLSTQHLRRFSILNEATGFQKGNPVAHAARLVAIMCDHHAGQRCVLNQAANQLFDAHLRLLIERRCRLVEQQDLGTIAQLICSLVKDTSLTCVMVT